VTLPEIALNYLGHVGKGVPNAMFRRTRREDQSATNAALLMERHHLIELMTQVESDKLSTTWLYRSDLWREATLRKLAQELLDYIRGLVASTPEAFSFHA
jgi:non-ribosomal peptide synthase protein (TIGR01720 family)